MSEEPYGRAKAAEIIAMIAKSFILEMMYCGV